MRLLFIGTSPAWRGTEAHLVALAAGLRRGGHELQVLANPQGAMRSELEARGVPWSPGVIRNAIDPVGIRAALKLGRVLRPDWVLASFGHEYWPAALIAKRLGAPLALFRHLARPLKWTTAHLLPADLWIGVSEFLLDRLAASGVPERKLRLLYNPIELNQFHVDPAARQATRDRLGLPARAVAVGFVGSALETKGFFVLADAIQRAMAQDERIHAVWVIDESNRSTAQRSLNTHPGHHHFLPWGSQIAAAYSAMDVLAVPSVVPEAFGRVAIEAQAGGVPVLVSDLGGLKETLVPDKTGFLTEPGNAESWLGAILRFVRMEPEKREAMGRAGTAFAQRFDADAIAAELLAILSPAFGQLGGSGRSGSADRPL